MATTTNYGWTTPDDTALVKDGASAIRTLGSSVDTTTKNLNPETTLADISFRSSTSNVNTRLGIGSTGNVLTVSGGVPTWAAPAGGGSLTLLSTTTLSGTSTTVSSIAQTHNHLYVVVFGVTLASNASYKWSTNITTSVYSFVQMVQGSPNGGLRLASSVGLDDMVEQPRSTGAKNTFTLLIQNYASTTARKTFTSELGYEGTSTDGRYVSIPGIISSTTAIDSFTFTNGSAVAQNSGTMLIYGVK